MLKSPFFAAALLLVSSVAAANSAIEKVNNQWTFSAGKQRMDYHEFDSYSEVPTKYLDSETGSQPYFSVNYVRQWNSDTTQNIYFKGSMALAHGQTNYNGYLYNNLTGVYTPYKTTTDITTFDLEGKLGKGYAIGRQAQLTPYVSLGFHEWVRDSSDDPNGYKEVYWHFAYGVGLLGQYALGSRWVAHADASIGRTTLGRAWADDTKDRYHLGARNVYTIDLGLTYLLDKKWSVHGGYRLTRFEYGESPVVKGYYEPESKTQLQTIYFGVGHQF